MKTEGARPAKNSTSGPAGVDCTILQAGCCHVVEAFFLPGGRLEPVDVPALFALIEHPREGAILFDTGYAPRFFEATRRLPYRLYRLLTPVRVRDDETAAARVRARGIDPAAVRWIILSHFDADHVGGLRDFPAAKIVCSRRAWEPIAGKTGLAALRARCLPGHLPDDLPSRLKLLSDPEGPGIGPFPASTDLFGDATIRIVDLPGHAPGQIGAFVRARTGEEYFLAGDGCWSLASLDGPRIGGGVHRLLAHDKQAQDATYGKLKRLAAEHPSIAIVPAHCARAASRVISPY